MFSRLMDRFLPDPRALDYTDRLARLTEIRAYVRAHFLRENADVDWTEIGAKVKRLVDERISAQVRELMRPVSILDQDFEQKIAALPHDEARASVMEHAIRAQIHEGLAANPAFFEKLSEQLERIIQDLRKRADRLGGGVQALCRDKATHQERGGHRRRARPDACIVRYLRTAGRTSRRRPTRPYRCGKSRPRTKRSSMSRRRTLPSRSSR